MRPAYTRGTDNPSLSHSHVAVASKKTPLNLASLLFAALWASCLIMHRHKLASFPGQTWWNTKWHKRYQNCVQKCRKIHICKFNRAALVHCICRRAELLSSAKGCFLSLWGLLAHFQRPHQSAWAALGLFHAAVSGFIDPEMEFYRLAAILGCRLVILPLSLHEHLILNLFVKWHR